MTLRYLCYPIVVGATLGGCANTASIHPAPAEQEIKVEQKSSVMFLQSLHGPERHRLRSFITATSRGRRDALHVGIIGPPKLVAQVAHEVRAMGVASYNIRLFASRMDLPASSGVRIEAITFEAHPPVCPSLSIVGPTVNDNSFSPTIGCSVRNNLAVIINDPGDLLGNDAVMPTSGDRAVLPITARGTTTSDNRSNLDDETRNKVAPENQ
ncbi:CpaD family pilus assembly lipoprotein [Bradyrhizobium sp. SBR1B]|uniref:CpaD family pilus assembly lipoprotein n=1 Tax=Bradyrhizobium sp. SBR1B TaxID=2663836 RepID=UPI00160668A1|nr:CpaD family pilus assembly lipoprotein [Bradyrhizobium sp. SBR1B]MBB4382609.1 pilus assembly protein CpaD [Bradyrhizobium sp. SBR1B]